MVVRGRGRISTWTGLTAMRALGLTLLMRKRNAIGEQNVIHVVGIP
jgi:hypothetical protein